MEWKSGSKTKLFKKKLEETPSIFSSGSVLRISSEGQFIHQTLEPYSVKNFNLLEALKTDLSKHKSCLIDPLGMGNDFNGKASTDRRKSQDEKHFTKTWSTQMKFGVKWGLRRAAMMRMSVSWVMKIHYLRMFSYQKRRESVKSVDKMKTAHFAVHLQQQHETEHESITKQMHIKRWMSTMCRHLYLRSDNDEKKCSEFLFWLLQVLSRKIFLRNWKKKIIRFPSNLSNARPTHDSNA